MVRQPDRQTGGQANSQAGGLADRQRGGHSGRQADQTGRQVDECMPNSN